MALITTAQVKAHAPIVDSGDDAVLDIIVAGVNTWVPSWLNRVLEDAAYVDHFDGVGGQALMLPNEPVTSVAYVKVDGVSIPVATTPVALGYRLHGRRLTINGYRFTSGLGNVEVSYQAGYTVVPSDIVLASLELAVQIYRDRERIGLTAKAINGETTSFFNGVMPARIANMLQPYRSMIPVA